uniref:Uncharacterized protein n=1 Tax=Triticum urartu TaxID=4572 RepID=A0A8R7PSK0_TRIUA
MLVIHVYALITILSAVISRLLGQHICLPKDYFFMC